MPEIKTKVIELSDAEKYQFIDKIYEHVLAVVNRALHKAKNYNISVLKLENPSYSEIANQLHQVVGLMDLLSNDLPENSETNHIYTISKAKEYVTTVAQMAQAITDGNQDLLQTLSEQLERRPFL